jgi:large subunit ribosomal protein L25
MIKLKVELRDKSIKADEVRKSGKIPAVFYGKKEASTPISINSVDFLKVLKEAGESSVVTLETPEGALDSLIHDVDYDPLSGSPQHADFYVFEKGHKVKVEVPIEFEGISPAIKDLGGTLVKVVHALKIEAMPKDLPHNVVADISGMVEFNSQVLAKDIPLPHGVELMENPEEVVALIAAPREEKEEETVPADLSQIELSEEKGKKDTEETEGEASTEPAA